MYSSIGFDLLAGETRRNSDLKETVEGSFSFSSFLLETRNFQAHTNSKFIPPSSFSESVKGFNRMDLTVYYLCRNISVVSSKAEAQNPDLSGRADGKNLGGETIHRRAAEHCLATRVFIHLFIYLFYHILVGLISN